MRAAFFSFIFLYVASGFAFAQSGNVEIIGAKQLDGRIEVKVSEFDSSEIDGYRIQLFFGTDMENAQKVKSKFISNYPELANETYMPYSQPYWRVRVGNFYTQLEAQSFFRELEDEFGSVFLVKDKITLPVLR